MKQKTQHRKLNKSDE